MSRGIVTERDDHAVFRLASRKRVSENGGRETGNVALMPARSNKSLELSPWVLVPTVTFSRIKQSAGLFMSGAQLNFMLSSPKHGLSEEAPSEVSQWEVFEDVATSRTVNGTCWTIPCPITAALM